MLANVVDVDQHSNSTGWLTCKEQRDNRQDLIGSVYAKGQGHQADSYDRRFDSTYRRKPTPICTQFGNRKGS